MVSYFLNPGRNLTFQTLLIVFERFLLKSINFFLSALGLHRQIWSPVFGGGGGLPLAPSCICLLFRVVPVSKVW